MSTTIRRVHEVEGQLGSEVLSGDPQTTAEAVLVKAILRPCATVAHASGILYLLESLLGANRLYCVQRVLVVEFALGECLIHERSASISKTPQCFLIGLPLRLSPGSSSVRSLEKGMLLTWLRLLVWVHRHQHMAILIFRIVLENVHVVCEADSRWM